MAATVYKCDPLWCAQEIQGEPLQASVSLRSGGEEGSCPPALLPGAALLLVRGAGALRLCTAPAWALLCCASPRRPPHLPSYLPRFPDIPLLCCLPKLACGIAVPLGRA